MIYKELFFIMLTAVFIADLSGFPGTVKTLLEDGGRRHIKSVRPLDCSLCLTWWSCLVYSIITGHLSAGIIAYIALLSCLAFPTATLLHIVFDFLSLLLDKLYKLCERM